MSLFRDHGLACRKFTQYTGVFSNQKSEHVRNDCTKMGLRQLTGEKRFKVQEVNKRVIPFSVSVYCSLINTARLQNVLLRCKQLKVSPACDRTRLTLPIGLWSTAKVCSGRVRSSMIFLEPLPCHIQKHGATTAINRQAPPSRTRQHI